MTRRVRVVCTLAVLLSVAACSRAPAPTVEALPTRTPKPTFTAVPEVSASPSFTALEAGTPVPEETVSATSVGMRTTASPQGTASPKPSAASGSAAPQPSNTAGPSIAAQPSSTPEPANTAPPTGASSPTPTPGQTGIPRPSPTVFACGSGYEEYRNEELGFAACPPSGWTLSEHDDEERSTRWCNFSPPTSNPQTGEGFQIVSVGVSPSSAEAEAALKQAALRLIKEYGDSLQGWPYSVTIDGRRSVEGHYKGLVVFETGVVELIGWEAVVIAGDRQWTIAVVARGELSAGVEELHKHFLSHVQILSD